MDFDNEIPGGGRGALELFAPEAAVAITDLEAIVWRRVDIDLIDLAARLVAKTHEVIELCRPRELPNSPWLGRRADTWRDFPDLSDDHKKVIAFAEQFTLDVSAIDDELRRGLFDVLGDAAAEFAQAVYVVDVIPRLRHTLDRIFGLSFGRATTQTKVLGPDATVWNGIEELIRIVPGLQALDPVMTELVRLRGARQHQCRFCKSVRSRSALVAGADDATFDAVDFYKTSNLPKRVKTALALTDAFIWTPGQIDHKVLNPLVCEFTPQEQVELVLDIARNASNKFAVSMAADAANVSEGYEVYEVHSDGRIEYGLTAP